MAKLVLKDREWAVGRSSTFSEDKIFRLETWTFGDGYWTWEIRPNDLFALDNDGPFRTGNARTKALAIAAAEAALLEEIGKVVEIREDEGKVNSETEDDDDRGHVFVEGFSTGCSQCGRNWENH